MDYQIWGASRLGRIDLALRREIVFYAPLTESLDFYGIEPVTFIRATPATRQGRDGQAYLIGANVPKFDFAGELPAGIWLSAGQALTYSAANGLDNSNTLVWIENDVAKSTPTSPNPISSSGLWTGTLNVHVRHIAKARRTLTAAEIFALQTGLGEVPVTAPPTPTPPPVFDPGVFIDEVPSGTINSTNKVFTLSQTPDVNSLIVAYSGLFMRRVASAPGNMDYTLSGTTITMGLAPAAGMTFSANYVVGP